MFFSRVANKTNSTEKTYEVVALTQMQSRKSTFESQKRNPTVIMSVSLSKLTNEIRCQFLITHIMSFQI